MKSRYLGLIAVLPVVVLLASSSSAAPVAAAPNPTTAPTATPTVAPKIAVKAFSKVEAQNAAAVPGETKNLQATLTIGSAPAVGKAVAFRIEGKNGTTVPNGGIDCGTATTDENGKAKLQFSFPELAQGAYALKARFAGDDKAASSGDDANLGMIKGITNIDLGDLIWGTYKNETGPKSGTLMIKLVRKADGKALNKSLKVTVNGSSWNIGGSSSTSSGINMIPLPNAATWNVKVQFDGDDANQAASGERNYTRPAS